MRALVDQPKEPFPLYRKKGDEYDIVLTKPGSEIWVCGECGVLHTRWDYGKGGEEDQKRRATECCLQQYCECGDKIEAGYTGPKCSGCNSTNRMTKILEKAEEITDIAALEDCPVFDDDQDKYWSSLSDFEDWVQDQLDDGMEVEDLPEWIFPCTVTGFAKQDILDLLESYLQDQHHEDAHESLVDVDKFQKQLDAWCKKQVLQSWHADMKRKIRVKQFLPETGEKNATG